jgi:hypothetical protein
MHLHRFAESRFAKLRFGKSFFFIGIYAYQLAFFSTSKSRLSTMSLIESDPRLPTDCQYMLDALTEEEKETAAKSSHRYFTSGDNRDKHVLATARRHWIAENGNRDKALLKMKATIQYRQDVHIDEIRRCFYERDNPDLHVYRQGLSNHLQTKKTVVRGFDKEGRPLYCVYPRLEMHEGWDAEWYPTTYCAYMLERAIAIAETKNEDKVTVVFDYTGFTLRNSPTSSHVGKFIHQFQNHYPERAHTIYIVNAPVVFRFFWALVRPFIDSVTRKKINFVTGNQQIQATFEAIVDVEDAQPFMLPAGKRTKEVDMDRFLHDIPFHEGYDE